VMEKPPRGLAGENPRRAGLLGGGAGVDVGQPGAEERSRQRQGGRERQVVPARRLGDGQWRSVEPKPHALEGLLGAGSVGEGVAIAPEGLLRVV
jgi:hypothetical protein